jgi:catechol 2,3-dioxygenase
VDIGHIHLKVADLERSLVFYRDVLGFSVTQRVGDSAAFLGAGGYHHHLALNTWDSQGAEPPRSDMTGLDHFAVRYPDRASLADALIRLQQAGIRIDGAADHGVSEAIYLRDPDGTGVKLYRDRPREEWPRNEDGSLAMSTRPLDLLDLLRHAQGVA